MMFVQSSENTRIRMSAAVSARTDVTPGGGIIRPAQSYGVWFVLETTGHTTGLCVVGVIGRVPDGSYFNIDEEQVTTITTNGLSYLLVNGPVPSDLGVRLIPAGGFNGRVAVYLRTPAHGGGQT